LACSNNSGSGLAGKRQADWFLGSIIRVHKDVAYRGEHFSKIERFPITKIIEKIANRGTLKETIDRLKPLFTDKPPVENPPKIPEKIQWVQPELVCEVAFAEWTEDGELRQTTFLGWRDDKSPADVILDLPDA
jgi:ATP-dependent DNA ligase